MIERAGCVSLQVHQFVQAAEKYSVDSKLARGQFFKLASHTITAHVCWAMMQSHAKYQKRIIL